MLLRWLLNTVGLMAVIGVVNLILPSSIKSAGFSSALWVILVLAALNAFLRPILRLVALPLNCLTLGLVGMVINLLLFWLAFRVTGKFEVEEGVRGIQAVALAYLGMMVVNTTTSLVVRKDN